MSSNNGRECASIATERMETTTDMTESLQWLLLKKSVSGDDLTTLRVASGYTSACDSACTSATLLELCDAMTTSAQIARHTQLGSAHFTTPHTEKELSEPNET